jgi:hypothetical protein
LGPDRPPETSPPVAFTVRYADEPDGERSPSVEVRGGRLLLRSPGAQAPTGHPASEDVFRDVILDCRLSLEEGADDTVYGVYVRQGEQARYVGWGVTPTGHCLIGLVDGGWTPLVDAALAPDLPFERGLGQPNRFQVVTCGPAITFVLNGAVVTAITVDTRYKDGYLGYWLLQGPSAERATLAVDWLQVRAVLPDQPSDG